MPSQHVRTETALSSPKRTNVGENLDVFIVFSDYRLNRRGDQQTLRWSND